MPELVKDEKRRDCPDCGVKPGEFHVPGCDLERCPKCKGPLIVCTCFVNNEEFDEEAFQKFGPIKWSGIPHEEEKLLCEEKDWWVHWQDGSGWVQCGRNHPHATYDLNRALAYRMTHPSE